MLLCLSVGLANMISHSSEAPLMVHVPAGEFLMGSNEGDADAEDDEHPQHSVYVSEFWIDKTEVTNAQYRKCVEAGTCRAPTTCDYGDPTYSDSSKADHPVVCVSWQDATTYCKWVGKRLPTEAEWEKGARGTNGWKYPWGNSFDGSRVNFCDVNCEFDDRDSSADDGYRRTAPVRSYPQGASPYGALDMAGNVYEWCQDWYDGNYYASSPQHDPQGSSSGVYRVLRGGSWCFNEGYVRAANRGGADPSLRNDAAGFRCVSQSPPTTMLVPAPTATPEPTDTPTRPTKPTSAQPAETILGESIRKQIYLEWVEAQNSKPGDEDVWQEIARRWGITVDAVEDIVVEGLNKKWLWSAATTTPVSPTPMPTAVPPTQPTTEIIPTPTVLVGSKTEVTRFQMGAVALISRRVSSESIGG
jgi:formylglycine-generating enzyme required for sulfatase activity